ncbi:MAG: ATP-dependent DNA helicase PcrA [candidate division BRC1 bacterium ADurb.BinA364]|nr:MAG: ATP-dependent DNA helicase PcrA [candidate division BRC1 bacterium ADurb.BinA364]
MRAANIDYRVFGGTRFYDRQEIKDILAYLQIVANPASNLALARVINKPRRGVGDKTLRALESFALERSEPLFLALTNPTALQGVSKKAVAALAEFAGMIAKWREAEGKIPLKALVQRILDDTGYIESLGEEDSLEAISRKENLEELIDSIAEYEEAAAQPSLLDYLEQVALTASADEEGEGDDFVSLMSLHAAKGLEFRAVFLIALEDGIFPSPRAIEEGLGEEERRLLYVGVTRAKERLYLSHAKQRMHHGRTDWTTPSVFIGELPREYCKARGRRLAEPQKKSAVAPKSRLSGLGRFGAKPAPKSAAPSKFAVGQTVEHLFMGRGEVVRIDDAAGERRILVRFFEDGETMPIIERYGDLKPA